MKFPLTPWPLHIRKQKVYAEDAPQFKSLNFSKDKGHRLTPDAINANMQSSKQSAAKLNASGEDEEPVTQQRKKGKRKGQSM